MPRIAPPPTLAPPPLVASSPQAERTTFLDLPSELHELIVAEGDLMDRSSLRQTCWALRGVGEWAVATRGAEAKSGMSTLEARQLGQSLILRDAAMSQALETGHLERVNFLGRLGVSVPARPGSLRTTGPLSSALRAPADIAAPAYGASVLEGDVMGREAIDPPDPNAPWQLSRSLIAAHIARGKPWATVERLAALHPEALHPEGVDAAFREKLVCLTREGVRGTLHGYDALQLALALSRSDIAQPLFARGLALDPESKQAFLEDQISDVLRTRRSEKGALLVKAGFPLERYLRGPENVEAPLLHGALAIRDFDLVNQVLERGVDWARDPDFARAALRLAQGAGPEFVERLSAAGAPRSGVE